jgi:hypothetical protein
VDFYDQRFQLSTLTVVENGHDLPRRGRIGGYVDGSAKEPTVDNLDLLEHRDVETVRTDLHKAEELHTAPSKLTTLAPTLTHVASRVAVTTEAILSP